MQFIHLSLSKLQRMPAAIELEVLYPTGSNFQPVYINRQTMSILNKYTLTTRGDDPEQLIPCLIIDVDPDHEIAAAIELGGGIEGALAARPAGQAASDQLGSYIVRLFAAQDRDHLEQMGQGMDYYHGFIEWILADDPAADEETPTPAGLQPTRYTSSAWDIPLIPLSAAPARLNNATWHAYGSSARTRKHNAIHFYVDDDKFRGVTLEQLLAKDCRVMTELNYSANGVYPKALALADIYRKRRISADCAAAGISIIADLNVSRSFFDIALLGIPAGYSAYSNRYYREDESHLYEAYELATQHAGSPIDYYIVGGNAAGALCAKNGWLWINSQEASGWDHGQTTQTSSKV